MQEARKNAGFEVVDRIVLRWQADGETAEALREHADLVAGEVLATEMARGSRRRRGPRALPLAEGNHLVPHNAVEH